MPLLTVNLPVTFGEVCMPRGDALEPSPRSVESCSTLNKGALPLACGADAGAVCAIEVAANKADSAIVYACFPIHSFIPCVFKDPLLIEAKFRFEVSVRARRSHKGRVKVR